MPDSPVIEKVIKVARTEDYDREVILNAGTRDGVSVGDRYLVYRHGKEVFDPDTKESLGIFEIVVGTGIITQVQEKLSILRSDKKEVVPKRIIKRPSIGILAGMLETEEIPPSNERLPFRDPQIGDLAKRLP